MTGKHVGRVRGYGGPYGAEVYGAPEHAGQWDAVATCFFIDTAHNVVEYLEIISRMLRPGGVWVNFGPLLFHWAAGGGGGSHQSTGPYAAPPVVYLSAAQPVVYLL